MPILALFDNSMFTYHKSPIVVMTESSAQGATIGISLFSEPEAIY